MTPRPSWLPVLLLLTLGCATSQVRNGPVAHVPVFAADDPRVETAGFVRETLRLTRTIDGTDYTLMAFAVGNTLTLGAMVKGEFQGRVDWLVGRRRLRFDFDTAAASSEVPVAVREDAAWTQARFTGQGASFEETHWINVELPLDDWLANDTALMLTFRPHGNDSVVLPDTGFAYCCVLVPQRREQ